MEPKHESSYGFIIDHRIPLWGVLSALGAIAAVLMGMWFTMGKLQEEVKDLKTIVKNGDSAATAISGEQAMQRFRIENIESELRMLKAMSMPSTSTTPRDRNASTH